MQSSAKTFLGTISKSIKSPNAVVRNTARVYMRNSHVMMINTKKLINKASCARYLALGLALIYANQHQKASCIVDEVIEKTKVEIDSGITRMRREFGTQMMSFPKVNYEIKGGRYSIDFLIDQRKCDVFSVLASVLAVLGTSKDSNNIIIKNFDSFKEGDIVNLQVEFEEAVGDKKRRWASKGTIYIMGEFTNDRANFKFIMEKTDDISAVDIKAFLAAYQEANKPNKFITNRKSNLPAAEGKDSSLTSAAANWLSGAGKQKSEAIKKLEEMGVTVFFPDKDSANLDWDYLAGYEQQKRDIEDTVLLALTYPEIYDEITQGTRMKVEPNRPKAVLFEGPPGTGKTTSAKIIARQVAIPLIYMPIESIMSKFYGESEKRFADIFEACKSLGRSIIFIDEIDAIASSRDNDLHEASRRILSTLLRKIDSFESDSDVLLVCATNRKRDLDQAMLSRIDLSIKFELPDEHARSAIFQRYAKQLKPEQLEVLAKISDGLSGRNISDVCKDAERRWASKFIRKEVKDKYPTLEQYMESLNSRKEQELA